MDLRQIRYFVAVAERGGFAAAASTLNVAQSALSRHVKELEAELGGALLERGARGVSVTESAKVLLARGRWLLGTIDDIKAEVRTENREPSGTVQIGAPPSLGDIPLPAARPDFREAVSARAARAERRPDRERIPSPVARRARSGYRADAAAQRSSRL